MSRDVTVIGIDHEARPAAPLPPNLSLIVGGRRHLDAHAPAEVERFPITTGMEAACAAISAATGPCAVLASGDPGWFGVVRQLHRLLPEATLTVHPAVSSVAAAYARLGLPWEQATIASAHGRHARAAFAALLNHSHVAVLTSPDHSPDHFARLLVSVGHGERPLIVVERLGHTDERIVRLTAAEAAHAEFASPNVLISATRLPEDKTVLAGGRSVQPWARPVSEFAHRDGQITKPAVRALALAHLAPSPGRLLWDIGCGSGSVAVEAAQLGAGVIGIERDGEQIERARLNSAGHHVRLGLIHADAQDALPDLPVADGAFIGGGGRALLDIVDLVARSGVSRIALALATVERVGAILRHLADLGWAAEAQQVAINRLSPLADGHRLQPENPVFLVTAAGPDNTGETQS
ncbi:precorrin-6y C5,15-methyltransferase (decarboxylating) subunit CbiE [Haloglycomyces albus]|uniref:precorrin-6y C5,15-methyltransferase (decarboxylating) subunit CbiE n=1 Tax=Haloglycomyces albus TaxID=526067 RepID=UPI00046CEE74|nr:precorrin-6y C5,15-methyltransferase (decarboxylating) subunit CbiE [Haloglycomyces albus]